MSNLTKIYKEYRMPLFLLLITILCVVLYMRLYKNNTLNNALMIESFTDGNTEMELDLSSVVTQGNLDKKVNDKLDDKLNNDSGELNFYTKDDIDNRLNNYLKTELDTTDFLTKDNAKDYYASKEFEDNFETNFEDKFDSYLNPFKDDGNVALINFMSDTLDRPIQGNKIIIDLLEVDKNSLSNNLKNSLVEDVEYEEGKSAEGSGSDEIASSATNLASKNTISRKDIRKAIDYYKLKDSKIESKFRDNINKVAESFVNSLRVLVTNLALTNNEVMNPKYDNIYKLWNSYINLENNPVIRYMLETANNNNRIGGSIKGKKRIIKNVPAINNYFGLNIDKIYANSHYTAGVLYKNRDKMLNFMKDKLGTDFFLHHFYNTTTENNNKFGIESDKIRWHNRYSRDSNLFYIKDGKIKKMNETNRSEDTTFNYTLTSEDKNYLIGKLLVNGNNINVIKNELDNSE